MGRKKIYTKEELDEKRRIYQREYAQREDVKKKRALSKKIWVEKNKEKINEYKRKNRKNSRKKDHAHFIGERVKWSAKKRGLSAPYTNTEYRAWYKSQKKVCAYCNSDVHKINQFLAMKGYKLKFKGLAIDRKDSLKGYLYENMVLACYVCNTSKQAIFSHEDFIQIAQKYIVPKLKKLQDNIGQQEQDQSISR
jgi:hypothetical protein